jgi:hypothetical protein
MRKRRFPEEQIIATLSEQERGMELAEMPRSRHQLCNLL